MTGGDIIMGIIVVIFGFIGYYIEDIIKIVIIGGIVFFLLLIYYESQSRKIKTTLNRVYNPQMGYRTEVLQTKIQLDKSWIFVLLYEVFCIKIVDKRITY